MSRAFVANLPSLGRNLHIFLWLTLAFVGVVLAILIAEDWQHLSKPARRVTATIVGFRSDIDEGARRFTARLSFTDETGQSVEVLDKVYGPNRAPVEGSQVDLVYPAGRPDMARVPRPLLRLLIYGFLGFLLVMVVLRMMGKIS